MRKNVQVYVVTYDKKILMLKRTQERSGHWQPVCGGIEKETVIEAASRELFEETGLKGDPSLMPMTFQYETMYHGKVTEMEDVCTVVMVDDILPVRLSKEHDLYKWCTFSEAKALTDWRPIHECLDYIEGKI